MEGKWWTINGKKELFEKIASRDEPNPQKSTGDIWKMVISDMGERRLMGIKKYGTPLQTNNGRNSLVDAYQEVLDLAVYLRQKIEEDKFLTTKHYRIKCIKCNGIYKSVYPEPLKYCPLCASLNEDGSTEVL